MWADVLFLNIWLPRPERARGWPPPAPPPPRPRTNRPPEGRGRRSAPSRRRGPPTPSRRSLPVRFCVRLRVSRPVLEAGPHCAAFRPVVGVVVPPSYPPPPPRRWYGPSGGAPGEASRDFPSLPPSRRLCGFQAGPGRAPTAAGRPPPRRGAQRLPSSLPAGRACLGLAAAEASPSPAFTAGSSGEPRRAGRAARLPGRSAGLRQG